MDVDCDGPDFNCRYHSSQISIDFASGNPDGQAETSFGNLSANRVPWVVIPQSLFDKQHIPPNAISAVICAGKMFYGVMGDTDGDNPEVIGEASRLLARTCFPNEDLDGDKSHAKVDVFCTLSHLLRLTSDFVFRTEFKEIGETTITNFEALKKLGDQKMRKLIRQLKKNR
jgi:chitosanase